MTLVTYPHLTSSAHIAKWRKGRETHKVPRAFDEEVGTQRIGIPYGQLGRTLGSEGFGANASVLDTEDSEASNVARRESRLSIQSRMSAPLSGGGEEGEDRERTANSFSNSSCAAYLALTLISPANASAPFACLGDSVRRIASFSLMVEVPSSRSRISSGSSSSVAVQPSSAVIGGGG